MCVPITLIFGCFKQMRYIRSMKCIVFSCAILTYVHVYSLNGDGFVSENVT